LFSLCCETNSHRPFAEREGKRQINKGKSPVHRAKMEDIAYSQLLNALLLCEELCVVYCCF
jgi:hypothetical protein